jgi:hypothetical protein
MMKTQFTGRRSFRVAAESLPTISPTFQHSDGLSQNKCIQAMQSASRPAIKSGDLHDSCEPMATPTSPLESASLCTPFHWIFEPKGGTARAFC